MDLIQQVPEDVRSTVPLTSHPLFKKRPDATREEAFRLSYQRARALGEHYGFTIDDILDVTPRFWDMHKNGIMLNDIGAHAMLSIQYNLAAGTIAPYAHQHADIASALQKVMDFEVSAGFMLTELAHGLDAKNLETTVTLQSDGTFILHTPRPEASKFVPPSMPVAGVPRIAVVMAKLMVDEENRGIRPVVVALGNGKEMCKGITSRLLPELGGIQTPYAITTFDQVHLPPTAVLGSLDKPADMRAHFFAMITRITTGTLAMALIMIPALKCVTYILGKYSLRRTVGVANKERVPIFSFRTQQAPILHALAQLAVMEPFAKQIIAWYKDPSFRPEVRNGFVVILKAIFIQMAQRSIPQLVERCGAQGLFEHNQICDADNLVRACSISEGDTMVLSIRLAVEICLGKYAMPEQTKTDCLLAKYEAGLAEDAMATIESIPKGHRNQEFARLLIPRCPPIVQGIGNRMVYEIAVDAGVDQDLIDLYEVGVVKENLSWYVEAGLLTRTKVREMENRALDHVQVRVEELIDKLDIVPYISAPIIKESTWESFMEGLPTFKGEAEYPLFDIVNSQDIVDGHNTVNGKDTVNGHNTVNGNDIVNSHDTVNGKDIVNGNNVVNGNDIENRSDIVNGHDVTNGYGIVKGSDLANQDNTVNESNILDGSDILNRNDVINGKDAVDGSDFINVNNMINGDDLVNGEVTVKQTQEDAPITEGLTV